MYMCVCIYIHAHARTKKNHKLITVLCVADNISDTLGGGAGAAGRGNALEETGSGEKQRAGSLPAGAGLHTGCA